MSNELIRPIDPETARALEELAKFGTKLLDSGDQAGGYASSVLGRLPHNLLGLAGDWLYHKRIRRWFELQADTKRILDERGIKEPYEDISPSIAIPLLEAAVDETREGLREQWASLLAAASDPNRKDLVRQSLITTLKQMDPLDALVLKAVFENGSPVWFPNGRDVLAEKLHKSQNEVHVSFNNLVKLQCISLPNLPDLNPSIAPLGSLLMRALRP